MSKISVDVSSARIPVLQVGYQGENEVTDVLFDISSWITEFGEGVAQLRVKRPGNSEDESYVLSLPITDGKAVWTVSETDTFNKGNGKVQLSYLVGNIVKKAVIYPYKVGKSIVGADNPVDPFDSWIERSKAWAIGETLDGDDVPETDETYQNNAKYYAEQADILGSAQVVLATEQATLATEKATLATEKAALATEKATLATEKAAAAAESQANAAASEAAVNGVSTQLTTRMSAIETEQSVQSSRIDTFTSLPEGSTSGNAELADIRVGADGTTYDTAGNAVRGQISELKSNLKATQNGYSYLFGYGTFVRGTLFSGALKPATTFRVTCVDILQFDYDITLDVTASFKFGIHLFENGEFTQEISWRTGPYTIPANTQFKIIFARRTEDTSETADIPTFVKQVTFKTETQKTLDKHGDSINAHEEYINKHPYKSVSTISVELLSQGSLNGTGGDDSYAATASARTDLLFAVNDIAIYADLDNYANARMYVHYFDATGAWVSSNGWSARDVIPKGSIFRLLFRKEYNSSTAHTLSAIFECFNIFANHKTNNIKPCLMVSHQGNVKTSDNNCKVEGYKKAALAGFDYGECDVKFTSDNVPVCCHDSAFTDATTGETISIPGHTLAELLTFDYNGGTISTFDEVVHTCKKYGIGLYIDQYSNSWTDAQYDAIFEVLKKYRFASFCKHIVYDTTCASKILSRDKTAWLICGQSYSSTTPDSSIELADSVITDYNKIDVMFSATLGIDAIKAAAMSMDARYGINVYTIDAASQRLEFAPYLTSITTDGDSKIYYS